MILAQQKIVEERGAAFDIFQLRDRLTNYTAVQDVLNHVFAVAAEGAGVVLAFSRAVLGGPAMVTQEDRGEVDSRGDMVTEQIDVALPAGELVANQMLSGSTRKCTRLYFQKSNRPIQNPRKSYRLLEGIRTGSR